MMYFGRNIGTGFAASAIVAAAVCGAPCPPDSDELGSLRPPTAEIEALLADVGAQVQRLRIATAAESPGSPVGGGAVVRRHMVVITPDGQRHEFSDDGTGTPPEVFTRAVPGFVGLEPWGAWRLGGEGGFAPESARQFIEMEMSAARARMDAALAAIAPHAPVAPSAPISPPIPRMTEPGGAVIVGPGGEVRRLRISSPREIGGAAPAAPSPRRAPSIEERMDRLERMLERLSEQKVGEVAAPARGSAPEPRKGNRGVSPRKPNEA